MRQTKTLTLRQALKRVALITLQDRRDVLAERAWLAERIREAAHEGRVTLVHGGMDCDCCAYEGRKCELPATFVHVNRAVERLYEDAEGPIHWVLMDPRDAARVRRTSRDLAMEAYEDGHPSTVYYSPGMLAEESGIA